MTPTIVLVSSAAAAASTRKTWDSFLREVHHSIHDGTPLPMDGAVDWDAVVLDKATIDNAANNASIDEYFRPTGYEGQSFNDLVQGFTETDENQQDNDKVLNLNREGTLKDAVGYLASVAALQSRHQNEEVQLTDMVAEVADKDAQIVKLQEQVAKLSASCKDGSNAQLVELQDKLKKMSKEMVVAGDNFKKSQADLKKSQADLEKSQGQLAGFVDLAAAWKVKQEEGDELLLALNQQEDFRKLVAGENGMSFISFFEKAPKEPCKIVHGVGANWPNPLFQSTDGSLSAEQCARKCYEDENCRYWWHNQKECRTSGKTKSACLYDWLPKDSSCGDVNSYSYKVWNEFPRPGHWTNQMDEFARKWMIADKPDGWKPGVDDYKVWSAGLSGGKYCLMDHNDEK